MTALIVDETPLEGYWPVMSILTQAPRSMTYNKPTFGVKNEENPAQLSPGGG